MGELDNFKATKEMGQGMWFLQKMLQISWTAKNSNETVMRETNSTRSLIYRIGKHQATFLDHVMRREQLELLVTTGLIEGKPNRGKKQEKMLFELKKGYM